MTMQEEQQELMTFPMDFPIKVMGLNDEALVRELHEMARGHFSKFDEGLTKTGLSRTGKYVSVTLTVRAESREQLDDFYRRAVAHPLVKVVL